MSSKRTRLRAVTVIGAAAVVAALGAVTFNASAAENSQAAAGAQAGAEFRGSGVPAAIKPPAGSRFIGFAIVATGTQTYTCTGGIFTGASTPEASLVGLPFGKVHHYKGPTWESTRDGSLVTATKTAESPKAGTIPELLLTVNGSQGTGPISKTKFIQRLRTSGGVAPAGACTDGETKAVAYGATYVFWS